MRSTGRRAAGLGARTASWSEVSFTSVSPPPRGRHRTKPQERRSRESGAPDAPMERPFRKIGQRRGSSQRTLRGYTRVGRNEDAERRASREPHIGRLSRVVSQPAQKVGLVTSPPFLMAMWLYDRLTDKKGATRCTNVVLDLPRRARRAPLGWIAISYRPDTCG